MSTKKDLKCNKTFFVAIYLKYGMIILGFIKWFIILSYKTGKE